MKEKNFFLFFGLWLKKVENNQRTNVLKYKIQKNRYMKIHNIFLATKVLKMNDVDPLGEQPRNPWSQRNKNDGNAKNKVKRSNWNPYEKKYKKPKNVPPNFNTFVILVNEGHWVEKHGQLNYCFVVHLVFEVIFDLIYYNSYFDALIKSCNSLNLKLQFMTLFVKLRTTVTLLFFDRAKAIWAKKKRNKRKM